MDCKISLSLLKGADYLYLPPSSLPKCAGSLSISRHGSAESAFCFTLKGSPAEDGPSSAVLILCIQSFGSFNPVCFGKCSSWLSKWRCRGWQSSFPAIPSRCHQLHALLSLSSSSPCPRHSQPSFPAPLLILNCVFVFPSHAADHFLINLWEAAQCLSWATTSSSVLVPVSRNTIQRQLDLNLKFLIHVLISWGGALVVFPG